MDNGQSLTETPAEYTIDDGQLVSYAQKRFYNSDLCREARRRLQDLVNSPQYSTSPPDFKDAPAFIDRHLQYISLHPKVNLDGYMSNLKLMTSIKHRM